MKARNAAQPRPGAISGSITLSKVVKIVADLLAEEMDRDLEKVRKKRTA